MRVRFIPTGCLIAGLLFTSGCGGGQSASLLQDVGVVLADYLILDLHSGSIEPRADVPDLATNGAYRTGKMVFKTINAGNATLGQAPGSWCAQSGETPTTAQVNKFYIAVFETTQAQWQTLSGVTPWTKVIPSSIVGGIVGVVDAPAFNLSTNSVVQALATANARLHVSLDVPTDVQWEFACRGGSTGHFSWGSDHSNATVKKFALVAETAAGHLGPDPVGSFLPNAFGLFDMEGNVWEITKEGNIRGGSWSDTLPEARAANKTNLDPSTVHALAGVRLVLRP